MNWGKMEGYRWKQRGWPGVESIGGREENIRIKGQGEGGRWRGKGRNERGGYMQRGDGKKKERIVQSLMMVSFMVSSVQVWGQDQIPTRPCHDVSLSRRKVIWCCPYQHVNTGYMYSVIESMMLCFRWAMFSFGLKPSYHPIFDNLQCAKMAVEHLAHLIT